MKETIEKYSRYIYILYAVDIVISVFLLLQGAIMAAVSSSKWNTFYNDPVVPDLNEEEVTSAGEFSPLCIQLHIRDTALY